MGLVSGANVDEECSDIHNFMKPGSMVLIPPHQILKSSLHVIHSRASKAIN